MTTPPTVERAELIRRLDELHASFDRRAVNSWFEPLSSVPLTMQQLKVLTMIAAERDRATGHLLAQALHVSLATMSGLVDRLVEQGMVQRSNDPADRRVRRLAVTTAGSATLRALVSRSNTMPPKVMDLLSDADLAALVRGMTALDAAMEKLSQG